jgi:hypothetical protein
MEQQDLRDNSKAIQELMVQQDLQESKEILEVME